MLKAENKVEKNYIIEKKAKKLLGRSYVKSESGLYKTKSGIKLDFPIS